MIVTVLSNNGTFDIKVDLNNASALTTLSKEKNLLLIT